MFWGRWPTSSQKVESRNPYCGLTHQKRHIHDCKLFNFEPCNQFLTLTITRIVLNSRYLGLLNLNCGIYDLPLTTCKQCQ